MIMYAGKLKSETITLRSQVIEVLDQCKLEIWLIVNEFKGQIIIGISGFTKMCSIQKYYNVMK